jgi:hypothetical protein
MGSRVDQKGLRENFQLDLGWKIPSKELGEPLAYL